MTDDIFKIRSCRGCVNAALNVYSNNFTKIFRATWIPVVIFSIVIGLNAFASSPATAQSNWSMVASIVGTITIAIFSFILSAHIQGIVVTMLNGTKLKDVRKKILKANIFMFAINAATGVLAACAIAVMLYSNFFGNISAATKMIGVAIILTVTFIAYAILCLPFIYSVTRYIFNSETKFRDIFGNAYRKGLRRLGFLFQLAVVIVLMYIVACIFLCVPACVTEVAKSIDNYGLIQGDASGLPSYFAWLNFLSTAIMSFIMLYMSIWGMFTCFYAYGSIDTTDNGKR